MHNYYVMRELCSKIRFILITKESIFIIEDKNQNLFNYNEEISLKCLRKQILSKIVNY